MTEEEFAQRYLITSPRTSRVYTRKMLLSRAARHPDMRLLKVSRAQIGAVLDDERWMTSCRSMAPGAVIEGAIYEAAWRAIER